MRYNCTGDDIEEVDEDENRFGVYCKCKCLIDVVQHKEVKNKYGDRRGGGMCPGCGGEE